jgi:hypothetical protein
MSAFSFPQFTHIHSNIFFTLIMKPLGGQRLSQRVKASTVLTRMIHRSCKFNVAEKTTVTSDDAYNGQLNTFECSQPARFSLLSSSKSLGCVVVFLHGKLYAHEAMRVGVSHNDFTAWSKIIRRKILSSGSTSAAKPALQFKTRTHQQDR